MTNLVEELNNKIIDLGASIFGYADLSSLPKETHYGLPYGISIGIALNARIVSNIPSGPFLEYNEEYEKVTSELDEICLEVSNYLIRNGYKAIPQTVLYVKNQRESNNGRAILPHKTVAAIAGLGWISKSTLLITKEFGSAIRITSIITDAPLPAKSSDYACLCGSCTKCVDSCPGKAIKNTYWAKGIDRDNLIDFDACRRTVIDRGKKFGKDHGMCGICIAVCPYTKRYLRK